jgi:hypothetical protein
LTLSADQNTWIDFPCINSQNLADTFLDLLNPEKWTSNPATRTIEEMQGIETMQDSGIDLHDGLSVNPISSAATVADAEDTNNMAITDIINGTASTADFIWNAPKQPRNTIYHGDEDNRRFRNCWFDMFSWLEYEETAECKAGGAFCFYCRQAKLRKLITTSKCESAFTSVGFHKWKNAVQMYKKHEMTASHKTSAAAVTAVLSNANVGAKISQQAEVIRTQNENADMHLHQFKVSLSPGLSHSG